MARKKKTESYRHNAIGYVRATKEELEKDPDYIEKQIELIKAFDPDCELIREEVFSSEEYETVLRRTLDKNDESLSSGGEHIPAADFLPDSLPGFTNVQELNTSFIDMIVVTGYDRLAPTIYDALRLTKSTYTNNYHFLDIGFSPASVLESCDDIDLIEMLYSFERIIDMERKREGRARARNRGNFAEGRKKAIHVSRNIDAAMKDLDTMTYKEVARKYGISVSTLTREKRSRSHNPG